MEFYLLGVDKLSKFLPFIFYLTASYKISDLYLFLVLDSEWTVSGSQLDLNDPRLLAMAAAERRLLEAEYDEYADSNANGAAFFRSAALIVSWLNCILHAVYIVKDDSNVVLPSFLVILALPFPPL